MIRYQDIAFRTAFVITRDATAAEDAAQEAFLRAYRTLPRFHMGSQFRPWLLKIVSNEAKRRTMTSIRDSRLGAKLSREPTTSAGSPESQVLALEDARLLQAAINRLPEGDRLVITYRFALDLTGPEIAEALGCPQGMVKSRLSRALARLRASLTQTEQEVLRVGAEA